ncbi:MAG: ABC transporter ATP-binding protein [Pseudomonadota bacterium]
MLRWFENSIELFSVGEPERPPTKLVAFYWHFIWPIRTYWFALLVTGFLAALIEVSFFAYLGQIVDLMRVSQTPETFFADHGLLLAWIAFIALVARPLVFGVDEILANQVIASPVSTRIRWQTHRYVLRQSLSFFQNDFAGRVANKLMNTAPSLRESLAQLFDAIWFVVVYTVSAIYLFAGADWRLTMPLVAWIAMYVAIIIFFVPRIKERATDTAEARSMLTGRIVDSYTNIMTVKLFAHADREDGYARAALLEHHEIYNRQLRLITLMNVLIWLSNGILIVSCGALAFWLWSVRLVSIGEIALIVALTIRIVNMSGWVIWVVRSIFENIGNVQEGMDTISQAHAVVDAPSAVPLKVDQGAIVYDGIRFHYGKQDGGIIENLSLSIKPGEKVALVGRSGAGKSTLVNLLLRFYDLEQGRITIDGQDISRVTQDSLRANIGMVTQDTSLLHRSVLDNILYGRPEATRDEAVRAAKMAQAHDFIPALLDAKDRAGYDAHVGERGVKLSGGQRQRIAIARILLKDAPILILDEATSALDSEVEAAIQDQLYNLMKGKTVIAIAHRLSTIAAMDRLVVMDQGQIVEEGDHQALLARGGLYASLWQRQSGGFLAKEDLGRAPQELPA